MVADSNLAEISGLEHVDCPICGPADRSTWLDDGQATRYVRCRTCGTVYASPRTPRAIRYSWLDHSFSASDDAFRNAAKRHPVLAAEADIINRHITGGAMLDVGCDLGDFFASHLPYLAPYHTIGACRHPTIRRMPLATQQIVAEKMHRLRFGRGET